MLRPGLVLRKPEDPSLSGSEETLLWLQDPGSTHSFRHSFLDLIFVRLAMQRPSDGHWATSMVTEGSQATRKTGKEERAVRPPGGGTMPSWRFPELLTHYCPRNNAAEADL